MSQLPCNWVIFLVFTAILACQNAPKETAASALPPIDSLFAQYHRERLPLFPIEATMAGDTRYNDLL
ncbi:MAG: hypothetical protein SFV22_14900, partial [Saprospiraceae bacterium]|nr:hypothetical protein [Saprospiraceae bacterium]